MQKTLSTQALQDRKTTPQTREEKPEQRPRRLTLEALEPRLAPDNGGTGGGGSWPL
jgi:hypothetical protein